MGIAKSIEAYAVCDFYTTNTDQFIRELSNKLDADFIINIYDNEYEQVGDEDTQTNFNKSKQYRLTITLDEYTIQDSTCILPTYELTVPINFVYKESIELIFNPNNCVHIMFLTFEHLWSSFIDILKFQSEYENRETAVVRYQTLRKEYTTILKNLGINKILILTHALYNIENIENIEDIEYIEKLSFDDIVKEAKEKDNLIAFDFQEILNATNTTQLDRAFVDKPKLEIMLLDNFG